MLVFFALGNPKVLSFALGITKLPDASSFASQWNIGLRLNKHVQDMHKIVTHKLYMFSKIRFYIGEKKQFYCLNNDLTYIRIL